MGPSSRADFSWPANRWLRRQDSNLQSPDPESGALPIWPLLSAAPQNITNGHHARHLASVMRTRGPHRNRRALSDRGMAQRFGVPIHQRVASREQRRILAMTFDHVAEFAEIVNEQAQASLVFVRRLESLQQIGHEIFEFGLLHFERYPECAFERDSRRRVAPRFLEQSAEPNDGRIL